ncbi:MAG TPA: diaminopimelate decarboxylase [Solirubrobacteraceae bacterium]|nr:diaminopimelate decarboxylase [Solirubrobacteraceae bacterium]
MTALQQLSPVFPIGSRINDQGHLEIGGCDALELAAEFGTPAYIVAEGDLRQRARQFTSAFAARTDNYEVVFASKAFPCTAVMRVFAEEGLGCDVASAGELALALRAGFPGEKIHLHGNAKSLDELRAARAAQVRHVVIDNLEEIERLAQVVAEDGGAPQPVSIRVTPGVRGDTHDKISTGQTDSKFGLTDDDIRRAIDRIEHSEQLELEGVHMHIGSQLLALAPFREAVEAIADLPAFREVNLGGGLGVAYTREQEPPRVEDYVNTKVQAVRDVFGEDVRVVDEPGRALVANSTVTLYTVQSVKRNVSTYVAVDGGMSDNLRPMLYGARYEAHAAAQPATGGSACKLVGKHCESGDVIVEDAHLPEPKVGDVIVTPATGGYGFAMANTYNGIPRAPVVFASDGDARLVVRRETAEELYDRDV